MMHDEALVTDLSPDPKVKAAMNEITAQRNWKNAAKEKAEGEKVSEQHIANASPVAGCRHGDVSSWRKPRCFCGHARCCHGALPSRCHTHTHTCFDGGLINEAASSTEK